MTAVPYRVVLPESELPTQWYNLVPDLPAPPPPPLHPGTLPAGRPGRPRAAVPDGPDPAGGHAASGTSTSPTRCSTSTGCGGRRRCTARTGWRRRSARRRASTTSTRASRPAGSHKPNTAVPQAFYNAAGRRHASSPPRPAPASGGRRSRSPARCSASSARSGRSARRYDQKPYRRSMMETFGATVHRSPVRADRVRPGGPAPRTRTTPARSASRSARRSRSPRSTTRRSGTRSAACSTTCCCTRRSSARRRCCSSRWSARRRTSSSAAPAAARTSAGSRSRSCGRSWPAGCRR